MGPVEHSLDPFAEEILDSIADGVFTVDAEWRITSFNRAAERITGVPRDEALGSLCCDVFRANICEGACALRSTLETGQPVIDKAVYVVKPDGGRIPISISTAVFRDEKGVVVGGVETFRDLRPVNEARDHLLGRSSYFGIVSRNHRMQKLFSILPGIAESLCTVLIEGPSGSGKELFARAIHRLSPVKDGPLVVVNSGAIPDTLLEAELFGYKAGAFTDARRDKPGKFALAKGGTFFLDEIGEISPALQVRLLRVLQDKVFEPLGATECQRTDARIVAATNKDVNELVRTGRLREDLYYRLNVVRLKLPPLAARKDDIALLVEHFVQQLNHATSKNIHGLSPEALSILKEYDYPGNVRELQNILEHAFVLCAGGLIQPEHLPQDIVAAHQAQRLASAPAADFAQAEARVIYEALKRNSFKRLATAHELGINKTTLWRKMKRLGINVPQH